MHLQNLLEHRRSVRLFSDKKSISPNDIEDCLRQATLAPTSSNMQLWQFIHLVDPKWREALTKACLGQTAASTAAQWVVFVTRQDLFRSRAKFLLNFEKKQSKKQTSETHRSERGLLRQIDAAVVCAIFPIVGNNKKTRRICNVSFSTSSS